LIIPIRNPKFELGQIVITPGAEEVIEKSGQDFSFFLQKHCAGDWGDLDTEDKAQNEQALSHGGRVMSSYKTLLSEKIWVISEGHGEDRVTTILTPSDY
jgi:hypothetical protein